MNAERERGFANFLLIIILLNLILVSCNSSPATAQVSVDSPPPTPGATYPTVEAESCLATLRLLDKNGNELWSGTPWQSPQEATAAIQNVLRLFPTQTNTLLATDQCDTAEIAALQSTISTESHIAAEENTSLAQLSDGSFTLEIITPTATMTVRLNLDEAWNPETDGSTVTVRSAQKQEIPTLWNLVTTGQGIQVGRLQTTSTTYYNDLPQFAQLMHQGVQETIRPLRQNQVVIMSFNSGESRFLSGANELNGGLWPANSEVRVTSDNIPTLTDWINSVDTTVLNQPITVDVYLVPEPNPQITGATQP